MTRPRLLDLFCGAGGCSMGYHRAGFDVVGVDLDQTAGRHYPFEFHQADALAYLATHGDQFDVVHASPPCQAYSITKNAHDKEHPELLEPVREQLQAWATTGGLYVIENVPGAPMDNPLTLCGSMFGLTAWDHAIQQTVRLRRHRLFEMNLFLFLTVQCRCPALQHIRVGGVYGGGWSKNATVDPTVKRTGGYSPPDDVRRELMGIDWMPRPQLNQAIPPVYTEFIGQHLLTHLNERRQTPCLTR